MTFEELVRAIGPGFHPDIAGSEYTNLPDGVTVEDYERIVGLAELEETCEGDIYDQTLNIFIRNGWA